MTAGQVGADSWLDLAALTIVGIPGVIGAVAAFWAGKRQHESTKRRLDSVRDQVQNTHDTNLRDDIDMKADKADIERVEGKLDSLAMSMAAYVAEDRRLRRDLVARLIRQERIADEFHPGAA